MAGTFEHGAPHRRRFATLIMTADSRFDITTDGRRFIISPAGQSGSVLYEYCALLI